MKFKDFKLSIIGNRRIVECSDMQNPLYGEFKMDASFEEWYPLIKTALATKQRSVSPDVMKGFGKALYRSLFRNDDAPEIKFRFDQLFSSLKQDERLRFYLNLQDKNLQIYPWEYLYYPKTGGYLSYHAKVSFCRWAPVEDLSGNSQVIQPPIKVLMIISNPPDSQFDEEKWLKSLNQVFAPFQEDQIIKTELHNPSISKIQKVVEREEFHIIHYLGHSIFEEDNGYLILMSEVGKPIKVHEDVITKGFLASASVKLVCLTACQSGEQVDYETFSGVAMKLMQQGIPAAVVAMQNNISVRDARKFSESFYKDILHEGLSVDLAVSNARRVIPMETEENKIRTDFGTPLLFMRTKQEKLFELSLAKPVTQNLSMSHSPEIKQKQSSEVVVNNSFCIPVILVTMNKHEADDLFKEIASGNDRDYKNFKEFIAEFEKNEIDIWKSHYADEREDWIPHTFPER